MHDPVKAFADALRANAVLTNLNLASNGLGARGAKALAEALKFNAVLTECNVRRNSLDSESAQALAAVAAEKHIMLFGIKQDQTEADLRGQNLGRVDAILIASDLRVSAVLTTLNLRSNDLGPEGGKALAEALRVNAVMTVCTLIKNKLDVESANMLAKIGTEKRIMLSGIKHDQTNFSNQGFQPADGILVASDLRVSTVLTTVNLAGNPCAPQRFLPFDSESGIGLEGAKAIAKALRVNAVLQKCDVRYNDMGEEAKAVLQEAVKGREGFELVL
jgi:hypothetical protein